MASATVKREEVPLSKLMVEENEWWSEAFESMRDMTMRGGVKFTGETKDRTICRLILYN